LIRLLVGALALLAGCTVEKGVPMNPSPRNVIECKLEAQETYVAGKPVLLRFLLRNRGDRTLYVLRWYTPLEGLAGKILSVTREGQAIPYRGIMAKRGDPLPEEYLTLAPGTEVSNEVDLARSYDLSAPGRYQVEFTSRLHDVAERKSSVPGKQDAHRPREISCGLVEFEIVQPND
jgi:peptidyl-Lys metalloendopeptidase